MMKKNARRLIYINLNDWTWWAWTITAILLALGLAGYEPGFLAAMAATAGQLFVFLVRDRDLGVFSIQLRVAYLLLLVISYPSPMRWLFWVPTVGTFALVIFGYCFMVRFLSLFPWNSREPITLARLRRTFFSASDLDRVKTKSSNAHCAGGLCTIEAQIPVEALQEGRRIPMAAPRRAALSTD